MAAAGSWPSIRRHGLLSTSALLDLHGIDGIRRNGIESCRRAASVVLDHAVHGRAVIRDNKPMSEGALARCLEDGLTPRDWYEILNRRVFFWLSRERLVRLLNAKSYARDEHDVLELDAAALVLAYRAHISLSPMNSGSTQRVPQPRGRATFLSIAAYPYGQWRKRRGRGERVVELAVSPGVPDIATFVRRVVRMQGDREVAVIAERDPGSAPSC